MKLPNLQRYADSESSEYATVPPDPLNINRGDD